MAIFRLTGTHGTDVDNIVSWLNTNKAGTFLENATIQIETQNPLPNTEYVHFGNTMSITKGGTVFRLAYIDGNNASGTYTFADVQSSDFTTQLGQIRYFSSTGYLLKQGNIMLCKNGILFTMHVYNSTTLTKSVCRLCLTDDGSGNLLMIGTDIKLSDGSVAYDTAVRVNSTPLYSAYITQLKPSQNYLGTAISSIAMFGTDVSAELENVFIATVSQQDVDAEQVEAVTMDGHDYITNGRIYILDE